MGNYCKEFDYVSRLLGKVYDGTFVTECVIVKKINLKLGLLGSMGDI
jgi:hypothetical protein